MNVAKVNSRYDKLSGCQIFLLEEFTLGGGVENYPQGARCQSTIRDDGDEFDPQVGRPIVHKACLKFKILYHEFWPNFISLER